MINKRNGFLNLGIALSVLALLVGCSPSTPAAPRSATSGPTPFTPPPVIQSRPSQTMQTLMFKSLAQGDSFTAALESPTLFVASSAAEAASFTQWLDDNDVITRIQEVDFNSAWVIAVFAGQVGSSGYSITIKQISLVQGALELIVEITRPDPGQYVVLDVISYPYHIVLLPRDNLNVTPGTIWSVYTQEGTLLTQRNYP
jgi:hypothetical protein